VSRRPATAIGLLVLAVFGASFWISAAGGSNNGDLVPGHRATALDVKPAALRVGALDSARAIPAQVARRKAKRAKAAAAAPSPAPAAAPAPRRRASPTPSSSPAPVQVTPAPAPVVRPAPAPAPPPVSNPGGGQNFDDSG
jgi:hypothetical protein